MTPFEEKYGIYIFGTQRYYKSDFTKKEYTFEHSSPFIYHIDDTEYPISNWGDFVEFTSKYLFNKYPETIHPGFGVKWSNRPVFSSDPTIFVWPRKVSETLYVDVNLTAVHMVWLVQDMLDACGYDLSKTFVYYRKRPTEEPEEVKKHYIDKNKALLKEYLMFQRSRSEVEAKKIIGVLELLDQRLKKYKENFESLFLFNDGQAFSCFKTNYLQYLFQTYVIKEQNKKGITKCIYYLGDFFWKFYKDN